MYVLLLFLSLLSLPLPYYWHNHHRDALQCISLDIVRGSAARYFWDRARETFHLHFLSSWMSWPVDWSRYYATNNNMALNLSRSALRRLRVRIILRFLSMNNEKGMRHLDPNCVVAISYCPLRPSLFYNVFFKNLKKIRHI